MLGQDRADPGFEEFQELGVRDGGRGLAEQERRNRQQQPRREGRTSHDAVPAQVELSGSRNSTTKSTARRPLLEHGPGTRFLLRIRVYWPTTCFARSISSISRTRRPRKRTLGMSK